MTDKYELRKLESVHPVLLFKSDLIELEKIISDSTSYRNDFLKIELTSNEKNFKASTFNDLFALHGLPESTGELSISRYAWNNENEEARIYRSISLTFNDSYIQLQISSDDEDWFNGKLARLRSFFKQHKPWYAILNRIHTIYPTISLGLLVYAIKKMLAGNMFFGGTLLFLSILFGAASVLCYTQRLFPHARIVLKKKHKIIFGINELSVLLTIVLVLLAIAQLIVAVTGGN